MPDDGSNDAPAVPVDDFPAFDPECPECGSDDVDMYMTHLLPFVECVCSACGNSWSQSWRGEHEEVAS